MTYALVSPQEPVGNGYRVAQLAGTPFDVAPPLFWKECSTDLYYGEWYYDPNTDQFVLLTPPTPTAPGGEPNVIG